MKHKILNKALSLCLIFLVGNTSLVQADSPLNEKPVVAVANYPLLYFTERIGNGHIETNFPIPPNVDPAFWNPQPK